MSGRNSYHCIRPDGSRAPDCSKRAGPSFVASTCRGLRGNGRIIEVSAWMCVLDERELAIDAESTQARWAGRHIPKRLTAAEAHEVIRVGRVSVVRCTVLSREPAPEQRGMRIWLGELHLQARCAASSFRQLPKAIRSCGQPRVPNCSRGPRAA